MRRATAVSLVLAVLLAGGGHCFGAPAWAKSYEDALKTSEARNMPIMLFFTSGPG